MLAPLLLAGCTFKGEPSVASAADANPASSHWLSRPTAIRVYPTTRFVRQGLPAGGEAAVLEARIELFDEMGDSVKGSGEFRLELKTASGPVAAGNVLYTWRVELRTIEDQRTHYDPITRGYLFRLRLDDLAVARRSTLLSVSYTDPAGRHFTAEAGIKTDW